MNRITLTLAFLMACTVPAMAAQWTVAGYAGWTDDFRSDVDIASPEDSTRLTFSSLNFRTRSFDKPLYYGVRAGYMFFPHLGVEFEMIHLKAYAELDHPVDTSGEVSSTPVEERLPPRQFVNRLNVSHGLNMLLGNVVVRLPVTSSVRLDGHLGLGPTLPHTEATVLGISSDHYESGGLAAQAAGGVEVSVWRGLGIIAEYKYTWTRQHLSAGSVEVEFPVRTHHVASGLSYQW